ncbi:MAG: hypothetical protein ACOYK8_03000 [Alphaproteobacteria bacterium]
MEKQENIPEIDVYDKIFRQYVEICNMAIAKNKDKFPYTEIWGARLKLVEAEMDVHAVIYDDRPKLSYRLKLNKEMAIEIVEKTEQPHQEAWPFTYEYMKKVVNSPREYIENPARLEWGWLKTIFTNR